MPVTRQQRRNPPAPDPANGGLPDDIRFLLEEIFDYLPDSPLHKAFLHQKVSCLLDFLSISEEVVENWVYPQSQPPDEDGNPTPDTNVPLERHHRGLLTGFRGYVSYRDDVMRDRINFNDIDRSMQHDDFHSYRASAHFQTFLHHKQVPVPVQNRNALGKTPAQLFTNSIKRDPTQFPIYKDESQWDHFNRELVATARSQGLEDVLNTNFIPATSEQADLFQLQQAFMYKVFVSTLYTNYGKTLVREYEATFDAQSIYKKLVISATKSVKADVEAGDLVTKITTTRLSADEWSSNREAFLLFWHDQVRRHRLLVSPNAGLTDDILRTLLENAVSLDPGLTEVKTQAQQIALATGQNCSFDQYKDLLKSRASLLDKQNIHIWTTSSFPFGSTSTSSTAI